MKKQRATFDINVSPLQQVWLDVLGVDAPWLAKTKAAPKVVEVLQGVTTDGVHEATGGTQVLTKKATHVRVPTVVKLEPALFEPASRIAKQNNGLDDLNEQIRACKACNLCQNRTQVVIGMGVQRPAIMIVGEAPSELEDRLGLSFAGPSGELLDKMLAAIGRQRDRDVYLTHVVKCRSPISRNPRPAEMAACQPFLFAEIAIIQPKLILAMGRSAAQALLGQDAPLETFREQVWSFDSASHAVTAVTSSAPASTSTAIAIPLLVTYHPAFLLSSPANKKRAWQDLQKARDLIFQV